MEVKDLLAKIKPKVNKVSDKYSWQLYQFIKKHEHTRVYMNKTEYNNGELSKTNMSDIIIGSTYTFDNSVIGTCLSRILSPDRNKYQLFCYLNNRLGWDLVDITDEFWKSYIENGRCSLDTSHNKWWIGEDSRYEEIDDNTKRCKWCGTMLYRHVEEIISEKVTWSTEN